ncbi:MAG TPA: hypothetical protein VHZ75_07490 [Solirubrobacteraceae bacterium]|jgi:hypothetical protein|nr:hypothetical protein [Solirubrobacteraceae bacterium]
MLRNAVTIDERDLERSLLRKSVDVLTDGRHACADCGRTPLVGEHVHHYAAGSAVCELCRPLRRGEPVRSERVRHSEYGNAVRVRRVTVPAEERVAAAQPTRG